MVYNYGSKWYPFEKDSKIQAGLMERSKITLNLASEKGDRTAGGYSFRLTCSVAFIFCYFPLQITSARKRVDHWFMPQFGWSLTESTYLLTKSTCSIQATMGERDERAPASIVVNALTPNFHPPHSSRNALTLSLSPSFLPSLIGLLHKVDFHSKTTQHECSWTAGGCL